MLLHDQSTALLLLPALPATAVTARPAASARWEYDILQVGVTWVDVGNPGILVGREYRRLVSPNADVGLRL